MSLPSKLTSYCAAGRPIVAATGPDGGTATVTIADVVQSNGVIHVIDAVLLPKS